MTHPSAQCIAAICEELLPLSDRLRDYQRSPASIGISRRLAPAIVAARVAGLSGILRLLTITREACLCAEKLGSGPKEMRPAATLVQAVIDILVAMTSTGEVPRDAYVRAEQASGIRFPVWYDSRTEGRASVPEQSEIDAFETALANHAGTLSAELRRQLSHPSPDSIEKIRNAVISIESRCPYGTQRFFLWLAMAWLDALSLGDPGNDDPLRILEDVVQTITEWGSAYAVDDALCATLLSAICDTTAGSARIETVREEFNIAGNGEIAEREVADRFVSAISQLRDAYKLAQGTGNLGNIHNMAATIHERSEKLKNSAFTELAGEMRQAIGKPEKRHAVSMAIETLSTLAEGKIKPAEQEKQLQEALSRLRDGVTSGDDPMAREKEYSTAITEWISPTIADELQMAEKTNGNAMRWRSMESALRRASRALRCTGHDEGALAAGRLAEDAARQLAGELPHYDFAPCFAGLATYVQSMAIHPQPDTSSLAMLLDGERIPPGMRAIFIEEARKLVSRISDMAADGPLPELRLLLHTLKGAALSSGALGLADGLRQVILHLDTEPGHAWLPHAIRVIGQWVEAIAEDVPFAIDVRSLMVPEGPLLEAGEDIAPQEEAHAVAEALPETEPPVSDASVSEQASGHDTRISDAIGIRMPENLPPPEEPATEAIDIQALSCISDQNGTEEAGTDVMMVAGAIPAPEKLPAESMVADSRHDVEKAGHDAELAAVTGCVSREDPAPETNALEGGNAVAAAIDTPESPVAADSLPETEDDSGMTDEAEEEAIDDSLIDIYLDEAKTIVPRVEAILAEWPSATKKLVNELRRHVHTLKGGARTIGAMRAGNAFHVVEDRLEAADDAPSAVDFPAMRSDLDKAFLLLDELRSASPGPATEESAVLPGPAGQAAPVAQPVTPASPAAEETLRVRRDTINGIENAIVNMTSLSSRGMRSTSMMRIRLRDLRELSVRMSALSRELQTSGELLVGGSRDGEHHFDAIELDRKTRLGELMVTLQEGLRDVGQICESMGDDLAAMSDIESSRAAAEHSVREEISRSTMTAFATLSPRLGRLVRAACRDTGKDATLAIEGSIDLPSQVLESIVYSLEHILRNAVAHGIEAPQDRLTAGKPSAGKITLRLSRDDDNAVITILDDGGGIHPARVIKRARERGLDVRGETMEEACRLLFHPGFSTADSVSAIAGRGVGLDVVRTDIEKMGGRVDIASETGKWTRFSLTVPSVMSTMNLVPMTVGGYRFLVPSSLVDDVTIIDTDRLPGHNESFLLDGIETIHLDGAALFGDVMAGSRRRRSLLVRMTTRNGRSALSVDECHQWQRMVMRAIGNLVIPGIVGGAVMPDGETCIIVNPVSMATTGKSSVSGIARPVLLVVDDSTTMRTLLSRTFRAHGFDVVEARDGMDAIEKLRDGLQPNLITLDVEMPRMNGFECAAQLRSSTVTADIPIVMVTSRTSEKHRAKAAQYGVDRYLGKPYSEDELMIAVNELLGQIA